MALYRCTRKDKKGEGEVVEESKGVDRQRRANGNDRKCVEDVSKNILLINAQLAANKYIRVRACLYACMWACVEWTLIKQLFSLEPHGALTKACGIRFFPTGNYGHFTSAYSGSRSSEKKGRDNKCDNNLKIRHDTRREHARNVAAIICRDNSARGAYERREERARDGRERGREKLLIKRLYIRRNVRSLSFKLKWTS